MTLNEIKRDVSSRMAAKYNAFYLAGVDDEDAEDVVGDVTGDRADNEYREWSFAYGAMFKFGGHVRASGFDDDSFQHVAESWLAEVNSRKKDVSKPSVFVVRDVHLVFDGAARGDDLALKAVSALKILLMALLYKPEDDGNLPVVFLVGLRAPIPPMVERLVTLYDVAYPREDEIRAIIYERADEIGDGIGVEDGEIRTLSNACRGLGRRAIRLLLNRIYEKTGLIGYDREVAHLIYEEKKQEIKKSQVLDLIDIDNLTLSDVGGLEALKAWLKDRKKLIEDPESAKKFHVDTPKGVMIVGMPGCGKSMTAKATAKTFNVQLLRLDMGSLMGKYVGESEANMRRALQLAEAASPCVLWIDEIEKAFSGVSAKGGGSEIATRLYGYFLTWMQEKKEMVFVVATANRIDLPPELFRRGRFDEVFYVDFPSRKEAEQILKLNLKKRSDTEVERKDIDAADFSVALDEICGNDKDRVFAGADVESIAILAVEKRYLSVADGSAGKPAISVKDAVGEIVASGIIKPIGLTMKDEIKETREKFNKMQLRSASEN